MTLRPGSLVLVFAAGCSLIRPSAAQYDYFVLTPTEGATTERLPVANRESTARIPVLIIAGVTLPGYLEREAMATRIAEHQISYSQRDRWAEPLDEALTRILRQNLAALLRPQVLVQARTVASPADYSVRIDVLRFERLGTAQVELWARFTLHARGQPVEAGETHAIEAARRDDAGSASEALSRAIATLSRDIAAVTLALPAGLTTQARNATARP